MEGGGGRCEMKIKCILGFKSAGTPNISNFNPILVQTLLRPTVRKHLRKRGRTK